jgi:probable phosphomutase (TIGR03848 family)
VTILLLVRHAVTEHTGTRLYGRMPGVTLSERGRRQADELAERLGSLRLEAIYSSPLERCVETAVPTARARRLRVRKEEGLVETDPGRWTGRTFASLARTRAWRRFHQAPSAARAPGGESLPDVQYRVVRALVRFAERHPSGVVAAFSHADPIRVALAHFAGIHLDQCQRLQISPVSVSAVALSDGVPRILRTNDTGTLRDLGG